MGVDSTNVASGRGRDSVRVSSKKSYNHGLIILDLDHMPGGACGTWPAFWTLGPNWPDGGEIDIIEGVNGMTSNNMALHTDAGCSIVNNGGFSGHLETDNCDVNAPGQANNAGCSIRSGNSGNYGTAFNANNGGVYATEWTSEAISIWFFPRGAIPSDISGGNPNPANWGIPQGKFQGACNIDDKFQDHKLVFTSTFCGDWAGGVWSTDATCSATGASCQAYVQNNPSAFTDTYWLINSLKVYTDNGGAAPTQSQPGAPTQSQPGVPSVVTTITGATTRTFTPTTFATVPSGGSGETDSTTTLFSTTTVTTYIPPGSAGTTPAPDPGAGQTTPNGNGNAPAPTSAQQQPTPAPAPSSDGSSGDGGFGGGGSGSWGGGRGGGGGGSWGGNGGGGFGGRGGGGGRGWVRRWFW